MNDIKQRHITEGGCTRASDYPGGLSCRQSGRTAESQCAWCRLEAERDRAVEALRDIAYSGKHYCYFREHRIDHRTCIEAGTAQWRMCEMRDTARSELSAIDDVLAHRPGLDKPTRMENIEHAIHTAVSATDRVNQLKREVAAKEADVKRLILARDSARSGEALARETMDLALARAQKAEQDRDRHHAWLRRTMTDQQIKAALAAKGTK